MKLCTNCQKVKPITDYYIKNKTTNNRYAWCKKCLNDYSIKYHNTIKTRAVAYKGGKCILCGYSKCNSAMAFHHVDPSQKDFGLGQNKTRKWSKIVIELDKCVLLCNNCHSEVHAGLIELPH